MIRNLFESATLSTTISPLKPSRFDAIPVQPVWTYSVRTALGPK